MLISLSWQNYAFPDESPGDLMADKDLTMLMFLHYPHVLPARGGVFDIRIGQMSILDQGCLILL